jgi:hypothetical protein
MPISEPKYRRILKNKGLPDAESLALQFDTKFEEKSITLSHSS